MDETYMLGGPTPITDNWFMRYWAAENLTINPDTTISAAMHRSSTIRHQDMTKPGIHPSITQRHRCWISRSIQHNDAQSHANVTYPAN